MADYLEVVYSEKERPYTSYPAELCLHLFQRFRMVRAWPFSRRGAAGASS